MSLNKMIVALLAPLALAGCFLVPGSFTSSLDLKRNGSFAFAYKGDVVFQVPDEMLGKGEAHDPWSDDKAYCTDAKSKPQTCSAAEVAEQKQSWEAARVANAKTREEEAKRFAQIFGYAPGDDAANARLAETIAKVDGFRSVIYRGKGVFDVDYAKAGRLDHDFVFPVLLQGNVLLPFVYARMQKDGAVRVGAPGYVPNAGLAALAALGGEKDFGEMGKFPARTSGVFTVTTDGEVATNNTEDGPTLAGGVRTLTWRVDAGTKAAPEALVRLR